MILYYQIKEKYGLLMEELSFVVLIPWVNTLLIKLGCMIVWSLFLMGVVHLLDQQLYDSLLFANNGGSSPVNGFHLLLAPIPENKK